MKNTPRIFFQLLFAACLFTAVSISHAAAPGALESYLKIQDALASDSMDAVAASSLEISKSATSEKIKKAALALSKAADIKSTRLLFKSLSAEMLTSVNHKAPSGLSIVTCEMAHASWLQKAGPVRNPYYGKSMLECGEVQK